jgi:TetR/AcrR family transcriptional regulator, transcriptional repressor for nem operon
MWREGVSRSGGRAYRQVLEAIIAIFEKGLATDGAEPRGRAIALAAHCIGGMAAARAVDDAELAHEIRKAAQELALSLAGWAELPAAAAE